MRHFKLAVSAIALALAGSTLAYAQAGEEHALTRLEAQSRAEKLFDRLDINHDGKLDAADRTARLSAIFDKIDTNHDGVISRDEFLAAHEHRGGMMDHGAGPQQGAPEMWHHHGAENDQWNHEPGDHQHGDQAHDGAGPMSGDDREHHEWGHNKQGERDMLLMAIFHRADPNHTGSITRDAFVAAALSLFDEADTNHDGVLTPEEHKAAWAAARAKMQERRDKGHWQDHDHNHGPAGSAPMPGAIMPPPGA